jgi:hypothetical protein
MKPGHHLPNNLFLTSFEFASSPIIRHNAAAVLMILADGGSA